VPVNELREFRAQLCWLHGDDAHVPSEDSKVNDEKNNEKKSKKSNKAESCQQIH